MISRRPAILVPLLLLGQTAAQAQRTPASDDGVFVVRAGGNVIGREEFTFRRAPDGGGRPLITLSAVNTYPPAEGTRTMAHFGMRRVTVRLATTRGEAAREYPAGPRYVVADDSVFALFAIAAHAEPGPVQVFYPRAGTRASGTLSDLGVQPTSVGGRPQELRHLVLAVEGRASHLWFDGEGRLMKVTFPGRDVVAERRIR